MSEEKLELINLPLEPEVVFDLMKSGEDFKDKRILVKDALKAIPAGKLFVYLKNVNIYPMLDFEGCTVEEKQCVFVQWLKLEQLYKNEEMINTLYQLIFLYNFPSSDIDINSIFTNDECKEILKWKSYRVCAQHITEYVANSITCYIDEFDKLGVIENDIDKHYKIIDDINYVPLNSVWLFTIPNSILFVTHCSCDKIYLTAQYQLPIYDGSTIHTYIHDPNNYLGLISSALVN